MGQLNGMDRSDNEFSVEQSLGSLLTPFYKNALANTQVNKGENYRAMVRKEIPLRSSAPGPTISMRSMSTPCTADKRNWPNSCATVPNSDTGKATSIWPNAT